MPDEENQCTCGGFIHPITGKCKECGSIGPWFPTDEPGILES